MAKWLTDLFEDYMKEELEEDIMSSSKMPPVVGGIYFGSLRTLDGSKPNKPLWFVVVDKVSRNGYEVFKVSDHYEFATSTDVIFDIGVAKIMVEVSNNFYLTEDEIKRFVLVHELSDRELQDLLEFRDDPERKPAGLKVGVTPIFEEDIRRQFNLAEFRQIEPWHLRIFELLDELEEEMAMEEEMMGDEE